MTWPHLRRAMIFWWPSFLRHTSQMSSLFDSSSANFRVIKSLNFNLWVASFEEAAAAPPVVYPSSPSRKRLYGHTIFAFAGLDMFAGVACCDDKPALVSFLSSSSAFSGIQKLVLIHYSLATWRTIPNYLFFMSMMACAFAYSLWPNLSILWLCCVLSA